MKAWISSEKGYFSRFSHELRTPVTSIVGYAEALLSEPTLPLETRKEFIEVIKQEGERLTSLVNELMELFALERGTVNLELKEGDIVQTVDLAIKAVSLSVDKKSLAITPFYDQPSIMARFDKERIFESILHLISNAVKFSPQEGKVIVAVRSDHSMVEIMVSDNGKASPLVMYPRCSEPSTVCKRQGEEIRGAGLGLAIAKHLVELHRGDISVISHEKDGSIFVLSFPRNHHRTKTKNSKGINS